MTISREHLRAVTSAHDEVNSLQSIIEDLTDERDELIARVAELEKQIEGNQ